MLRTVLVPQIGVDTDKQSLATAYEWLRENGGHLECLYVHDDAAAIASCIQTDAMGVPVVTPQLLTVLNEEAKAEKAKARQAFDAFCTTHGIATEAPVGAISASWQAADADVVATISAQGRYHDATFLARGLSATDLGTIAISSGRPLILVPANRKPRPPARIAIAWKETSEAAHAVTAALPLLKRAETVTIFTVTESSDAHASRRAAHACARYLKQHDIDAESSHLEAGDKSASSVLLSEAAGADLLIMGAYGHSRLRELVFGGFTREILSGGEMPVFLMH